MTDVAKLLESRRSRFGRWSGAALVVFGLHVGGGALAVMHWVEEEVEDSGGALSIEMAPLPAAAPVDTPDLALGPVTQDATETPQVTEKVEEQAVEDIPPVDPSPAPEPEIALPKPPPEEKKEEPERQEEPKEAASEKDTPQEASEAQVAMAPPRVEAQPAPASAPSPGQSASLARALASWQNGLVEKLNRFKRYPAAAVRRGDKGVAVVRFTVDRSGNVIAAHVVESSGSQILDDEALALLRRISPVPAPPDGVPDEMLDNIVPVWFGMKPKR